MGQPVQEVLIQNLSIALADAILGYTDDPTEIAELITNVAYDVVNEGAFEVPALVAIALKRQASFMVDYYRDDNERI